MERESEAERYEDSSITVCVRVRPLNKQELEATSDLAISISGEHSVDLFESGIPKDVALLTDNDMVKRRDFHRFNFDMVFDRSVSQEAVYQRIAHPVVTSSFKGFNNCIFAYGQTGSGKTYTMVGAAGMGEDRGIIPRICEGLFKEAETMKASKVRKEGEVKSTEGDGEDDVDIAFYVTYLEIYMERIRCLLSSAKSSASLKVRQHPTLGIYVEGLREVPVASSNQLLALMKAGNAKRRTTKTGMNDTSSRSHAVFSIKVIQKNVMCQINSEAIVSEIGSKINLVDLAGSERAKSTKAEGDLLKEGAQINKSLTTLGIVINALAELSKQEGRGKSNNFVPYRDSTLTFLLKESLGGNSKTLMVATVSPALNNASETLSTLRYADRAKLIVTRAFINETPQDKCIRELKEEVARLRDHIKSLEKSSTSNTSQETTQNVSLMKSELCRAEELIQQRTRSNKDREIEANLALESIQQQTTLHVTRKEPYILNMDGAGDWVMQYFIVSETYITSKPLVGAVLVSEIKKDDNKMYILVPEDLAGGIGNPHCVFIKNNYGSICLSSCCEGETYVNDRLLIEGEECNLSSGDMISIGDELLQFRFMDPVAPIRTGRRRNLLPSARDSANQSPLYCDPKGQMDASLDPEPPLYDPEGPLSRRKRRSSSEIPYFSLVLPFNSPRSRGKESQREHSQRYSPRQSARVVEAEQDEVPISGRHPSPTSRLTPRNTLSSRGLSPRKREKIAVDAKKSIFQHTFVFTGPFREGKTLVIANICKPRRLHLMFPFIRGFCYGKATFGIQYSTLWTNQKMCLNFLDLSGVSNFSVLTDRLPVLQATYVLTFSLQNNIASSVKRSLDVIAYQLFNRSISIILLGTFYYTRSSSIAHKFEEAEQAVLHYFEALNAEIIPSIAGKFAVDNLKFRVQSFGFAKIDNLFELQQWFVDHAAHQSSLDVDYPNSLVPERCINLANALQQSKAAGFWYLSNRQFAQIASKVSNDYAEDARLLQRESQLLARWGVVLLLSKETVIINLQLAADVVAILSLCRHFSFTNSGIQVDVMPHESEGLLVFSSLFLRRFSELAINPQSILKADEYGLLTHGVMTSIVFKTIFENYMNSQLKCDIEVLASFLQDSHWMFESGKLLFFSESDQLPMSVESEPKKLFKSDNFYLIPLSFFQFPSAAIDQHLSRFLLGPFFRMKFPILPPKFFSRLICSLSSVTNAVYVGPYNLCEITSQNESSPEAPVEISCIPATPRFWSNAVWLVGPRSGRAFLCVKGDCIYSSFHTIDESDNPFVETVLGCISSLDSFNISEWRVAVQPSGVGASTPVGAAEPENISYYILEDKANYTYFLRQQSDEVVQLSQQLEDTLAFGDETVLNVTTFTRSMEKIVDLDTLEDEILQEKKAGNRFSDILASWRNTLSESRNQPEMDSAAGRALDTLVDALGRLP